MAVDQKFLDVVEHVYRAATEACQWPVALEAVADCLDAQHAHLFVADGKTMTPSFAAVSERMSRDRLDEFHSYYQSIDPRLKAGRAVPAGIVVPDHVLCPPEEFERSEFYNDFYRRCGSRYMMAVNLQNDEEHMAAVAIVRTPNQQEFRERDIEILSFLKPHLTNAVRVQQRLGVEHRLRRLEHDALDLLAVGVVVFGPHGQVVMANSAIRRIAESNDGLTLCRDGLRAASAGADSRLRRAFAVARGPLGDASSAGFPALVVPRRSGRRGYEVLFASLPSGRTPWCETGGVLAVVSDPEAMPLMPERLLRRMYGFTAAEARVAAALASGMSLAEIAESGGHTREAVRWHLKQLFQKTRTHRQAELVRLLRGSVLNQLQLIEAFTDTDPPP